jgi:hypothetical protein
VEAKPRPFWPAFFDHPERLQDTPKIACFPTLGACFSRVDHCLKKYGLPSDRQSH